MFLSCKGRQATRMRSKTTLISDYIQILLFLCVCVYSFVGSKGTGISESGALVIYTVVGGAFVLDFLHEGTECRLLSHTCRA